jgi:methionyl aminopeptidase
MSKKIHIKTTAQIAAIRKAGEILNELLILIAKSANAGVSLHTLEKQADMFLNNKGVIGSFKGYNGFPANLCLSVNDCVVHGIPDTTVLKN